MSPGWPLLVLLFGLGSADAAINRCSGIDGVLVYTDRTCESLGFAERSRPPMPRRRVGAAPASGHLGSGCAARSPEALRHAVMDALDRGDFNALAGLYNFDGRSRQTAAGVVRRLERMAKRSVLEVELVVAELDSLSDVLLAEPTELPTLRVVQPTGASAGPYTVESFRIAHSAGCVWLGG